MIDSMSDKISKTEEEWRQQLTPEEFEVCRNKGTEEPFSGKYWDCKEEGIYRCTGCGTELFSADTKFDSSTGWPSFWAPVSDQGVGAEVDDSLHMRRTEVLCGKCDAHLGHVFPDGPQPTGQRYCINSVSLKLDKD